MATITKEENNGLRFIKAMNLCGKRVLYNTFRLGTPDKADDTKLDDYLKKLNQTSSANYLKLSRNQKRFNKTQKNLINKSPDGKEFDISLLCLSIKLACEKVAPLSDPIWNTHSTEMEYYVTAIQNMRNDSHHSQFSFPDEDYFQNIFKFRELLTGCLKASGKRYGQDEATVDKEIKQINDDLEDIMNEILGEEDIIKYCSDDIKQIIINESCDKLKEIFQNIIYINPVSFITNDFHLEVDKIFVDIEVRHGKRGGKGQHVEYQDLLKIVHTTSTPSLASSTTQQQSCSARPQILLLEGLAGSGKTTLVTLVIEEWIKGGQGHIRDLHNYELLLWVQCRDHTMKSYQDLLDCLIPNVSAKFRNFLPRIMKFCKILIIVDGLDELNDNSRTLVKNLLHEFQNSTYTTFLCTSRPEKIEIFRMTIPEEYDVSNAELRGINKEHMQEFVRRTHQEIKRYTKSSRSTEELVSEVKAFEGLHEHLRLPMNLTFFVYIWDQTCGDLNAMTITQTELYNKIHRLCQNKLLDRLAKCPKTKAMNKRNIKYRVREILKMIYMTSLESLSHEQLAFDEATVEQLISACTKNDLPHDEVLSAFLSLKPIWTWQGIEERYSAPHKGIQDYFSALHIVMTLRDQLKSSALSITYVKPPSPPVSSQPLAILASPSPTPAPLTLACVTQPTQEPPTLVPVVPAPTVSVRSVLEQSVSAAKVDMTKYHNVLLHVAGLLQLLLDWVPEATMQEVVHLIHEAGKKGEFKHESSMNDENDDESNTSDEDDDDSSISDEDDKTSNMSKVSQWHTLLENTKCNAYIAKAIACFINTEKHISIEDHHVRCFMALLPHLRPSKVHIRISFELADVTGLLDLLAALPHHHHRCTLLDLSYHYRHNDVTATSDDILQCVQPRSDLLSFQGRLTAQGVSLLPPSLKELSLSLMNDDHARQLLPQLQAAVTSTLPHLVALSIKVLEGVSPVSLMSLPPARVVSLELSAVSDLGAIDACDVVQELQPPGGYRLIMCENSTLTEVGCQNMIHGLAHRQIKVQFFVVDTSVNMTEEQEHQLDRLAKNTLGSGFNKVIREKEHLSR